MRLLLQGTSVADVYVTRPTAEECLAVAIAKWGGMPDQVVIQWLGDE
jgi:hypothetical protein